MANDPAYSRLLARSKLAADLSEGIAHQSVLAGLSKRDLLKAAGVRRRKPRAALGTHDCKRLRVSEVADLAHALGLRVVVKFVADDGEGE
ncbi:MAG: hypothetical protein AAF196_06185 [Planctomycetota bacterium]